MNQATLQQKLDKIIRGFFQKHGLDAAKKKSRYLKISEPSTHTQPKKNTHLILQV